jgi:hypothetical protein
LKAVEFHGARGDFESWAEHSLQDVFFSRQLEKAHAAKLKGEVLRQALVETADKRFVELVKQVQKATRLF